MKLSKSHEPFKKSLRIQFDSLNQLIVRLGNDELSTTSKDLLTSIDDPYMFVIVGEVKSGKSSFINALLDTGKEICKVAPSPMTDCIQQIVYGESESEVQISPYIKRIYQNVDILKHIAIVDTPGTNTIIEHHQEVTESFIPSSDLIVFVFEAKNPYRQSAWEFFDFIHSEWHKKIIFILQQKDLLNEEDLSINIQGVIQQARSKGIMEANVFAVSAIDELNNKRDISGFKPLKEYIYKNVTGASAAFQKLVNLISTSEQITNKIIKGLGLRKKQLDYDISFRADIQQKLDDQVKKSNRYSEMLVENLIACYERVMTTRKEILKENIGFFSLLKRSFGTIFSSESNLKKWLEEFNSEIETTLNKEFKTRLDDGIVDISVSIQDMAKLVDVKLRTSETILKDNHEIFSDIAEKRSLVMQDLQKTFKSFLENSENFYTEEVGHKTRSIIPDIAKGSGLAIIGIIITTITNTAVFDITGGVITAIGFSFAGISLGLSKKNILKSFQNAVDEGRAKIEKELSFELSQYAGKIKDKIVDNFSSFDKHIQQETNEVKALEDEISKISSSLSNIKSDIQKEIYRIIS